jgi:myosin protein heavy chain
LIDETRQKHSALLSTARSYEEMSTMVAREGQLRGEEVRILRAESEQLRGQNGELKMKTMVEVDALQEQLRVRKEKQYQLLEKLQAQEEAKRQAEDQLAGMEDQLRSLHARNVELDTQLQVEARIKLSFEETNKELTMENSNIFNENKEVQIKIEKSERERLRMEAETRDSGEQLREMAEKVFQLLERLKLAELSKTKALESLKKKEQDVVGLQKKGEFFFVINFYY